VLVFALGEFFNGDPIMCKPSGELLVRAATDEKFLRERVQFASSVEHVLADEAAELVEPRCDVLWTHARPN